jgi:hypothetical protein
MALLTSVDLFTGIGGFVVGLEGYAEPILYCDRNEDVVKCLDKLMASGRIPKAPVATDVQDTQSIVNAVGSRKVNLVTAGFPCTGFSLAGAKKGFSNEHSSLFYDAMRVVRALKPDMVMYENVHGILSVNGGADYRDVIDNMTADGYACEWTICSAHDVGSPQLRKHWFCLCVREGYDPPAFEPGELDAWDLSTMPPLVSPRDPNHVARYAMLGNTIVPQSARKAMAHLLSVHRDRPVGDTRDRKACTRRGPTVDYEIVIDPAHHTTNVREWLGNKLYKPAPLVERPVVIPRWPTPRSSNSAPAHRISIRSMHDLPTTALFASKVGGIAQAPTADGQTINIPFVEWLMGYPPNWTDFSSRISA